MSAQTEPNASVLDTVKLVLAVVVLVLGIAAFYYISDFPTLYRVLTVLAAAAFALALVSRTLLGGAILGFLVESRIEVRKMVWPSRQETMQATLMVVVLVFIVGLLLWLLDSVLFWWIGLLTGQKI